MRSIAGNEQGGDTMPSFRGQGLASRCALRLALIAGWAAFAAGGTAAQSERGPLDHGASTQADRGAIAQTERATFDHEGLAWRALEGHIRPLYADFANRAEALRLSLETACRRREANDGTVLTAAYRETLLAWSRVEHLRFGPIVDGNRFERVVYWPDRKKIGERQ